LHREFVKTTIIGTTAGYAESIRARREGQKLEERIEELRKTWVLIPPSAMAINLNPDAGELSGLILCVPQTVGRTLLRRRECSIIERDYVAVDAVLEGEHEQLLAVFGIGLGAE